MIHLNKQEEEELSSEAHRVKNDGSLRLHFFEVFVYFWTYDAKLSVKGSNKANQIEPKLPLDEYLTLLEAAIDQSS